MVARKRVQSYASYRNEEHTSSKATARSSRVTSSGSSMPSNLFRSMSLGSSIIMVSLTCDMIARTKEEIKSQRKKQQQCLQIFSAMVSLEKKMTKNYSILGEDGSIHKNSLQKTRFIQSLYEHLACTLLLTRHQQVVVFSAVLLITQTDLTRSE